MPAESVAASPLSLTARLLIAAGLVLAAFVLLTGALLDNAFRNSALVAVQQRLQAQVYILLSAADVDGRQQLNLPKALPEARFSIPGSGLYATVIDADGRPLWRSPSLLGVDLGTLPVTATPGVAEFGTRAAADGEPLFTLGFGVSWEIDAQQYRRYTFWVAETMAGFEAQVKRFRRSLWSWLLLAAGALLLVQTLVLRWSLTPLRRIAQQVSDIETGRRSALSEAQPAELRPLVDNLNGLIGQSRSNLERYRNAVGDLAHTLKTPLAVLRSAIADPGARAGAPALGATVQEQVERMNESVEYHLQRAAASGRVALTAPVALAPVARKITDSLRKVYRDKALELRVAVPADARFFGDEGDLMEVLGNLADNACKWAERRVGIRAASSVDADGRERLRISVDDDGPGIPDGKVSTIAERGARADPDTPGHGIGLAVVRDIVEEVYRGRLTIGRGPLGGATVTVEVPGPRG